jgi:ribosomal protein S18 acetylase RimI-like enzyme
MPVHEIRDLSATDQPNDNALRTLCIETISQGLAGSDSLKRRDANDRPLVLAMFDDEERIIGGLLGKLLRGWLRVDVLWVAAEQRGLGLGTKLMQQAEAIAVAHNCHSAHLDSYSFQAPGFYLTLGYEVFGQLDDYPMGETRYYFKKRLSSGG